MLLLLTMNIPRKNIIGSDAKKFTLLYMDHVSAKLFYKIKQTIELKMRYSGKVCLHEIHELIFQADRALLY